MIAEWQEKINENKNLNENAHKTNEYVCIYRREMVNKIENYLLTLSPAGEMCLSGY